jgi:hypothetical protein
LRPTLLFTIASNKSKDNSDQGNGNKCSSIPMLLFCRDGEKKSVSNSPGFSLSESRLLHRRNSHD